MKVLIGRNNATLDSSDILGVGGEATVYRCGDRAVKIFHPGDRVLLDAKMRKLAAFPRDLPPQVVAPEQIVFDARTQDAIGYAMPAIKGAHDLSQLMKKSFRTGAIPNAEVCALFAELHDVLSALHAKRAIVGDLNDGNVLFSGRRPWIIDVDSMQLPGHPCLVAHERYLDPNLYGRDLGAGCLSEDSDWYAFAVLLFSSLLYVHPYGGVHPSHATLLRRAEAKISVFDPSVKYPKSADDWRSLPDRMIEHFRAVFEHGLRGGFPRALLALPAAGQKVAPAKQQDVRVNRGCQAILIFNTRGRILTATVQPSLAYVYEEDGVVRREDGSRVMEQPAAPGMRFAIAGAKTWVGFDGKLACVERERVVDRTIFSGTFDASTAGCFVPTEGWLIERETRARIGKVLDGQTFVRVGRTLGFGFYRAGKTLFAFLFKPGRPGLIDVRLPSFEGRLIACDAVFDDRHAVVSFLFDRKGVRCGALYSISDDGTVVASLEGSIEEERILADTGGRAVQNGRILAATDEGLTLLGIDRTVFTDTEPFVEEGAQILPGPNGTLYTITDHEIRQLSLS